MNKLLTEIVCGRERVHTESHPMRQPTIDDIVLLKSDVPELLLRRGERGVVCAIWCAPEAAYEIDFIEPGLDTHTRAILMAEHIEVVVTSTDQRDGADGASTQS